jgi:hypothetical protein
MHEQDSYSMPAFACLHQAGGEAEKKILRGVLLAVIMLLVEILTGFVGAILLMGLEGGEAQPRLRGCRPF